MVRGIEFHNIIQNIFDEVKGFEKSSQVQVNCPRCQERDGLPYPDGKFNLEINTSKRVFRCWKCDEPRFSGSLGRLIKIYGTSIDYNIYKSYVNIFSDYSYDEDEKEFEVVKLPDEMISFSQADLTKHDHFEAYNYLVNDRLISREKILKYQLGFCLNGRYKKRIIIPSYDSEGEVNYFVSRSYLTNRKVNPYDNPKSNKDIIIFNEGFINFDSTVYLVEGVFEMFSLENAIPLLGKQISTALFNKLSYYKPNVIVLLDPDAIIDAVDLLYALKNIYYDCKDKVKIVHIDKEKDLDDVRKKYGKLEIIKSLREARDFEVNDYFLKNNYLSNEQFKYRGYNTYRKYY